MYGLIPLPLTSRVSPPSYAQLPGGAAAAAGERPPLALRAPPGCRKWPPADTRAFTLVRRSTGGGECAAAANADCAAAAAPTASLAAAVAAAARRRAGEATAAARPLPPGAARPGSLRLLRV